MGQARNAYIYENELLVNPGKLKKILLFSALAVLSALLWYGNSHWRISDRRRPLEKQHFATGIDRFSVDRTVCFELTHARMFVLSGIRWQISVDTGSERVLVFDGTRSQLSCKKVGLPEPGTDGKYFISVDGIDQGGKTVHHWSSDVNHELKRTGINYIHLLYTGDAQESITLNVSH